MTLQKKKSERAVAFFPKDKFAQRVREQNIIKKN